FARRETEPATTEGGSGDQVGARMRGGAGHEPLDRPAGLVGQARRETDVDEKDQQWRGRRALRVELAQGSFEDVLGDRDVSVAQVQGRERACSVEVGVQAVEQLRSLLEPTLP